MNTRFGTWQFSDEMVPKVEAFLTQCLQVQDYSLQIDPDDPRHILFASAYGSLPTLGRQPTPVIESDDDSGDELERKHRLASNGELVPEAMDSADASYSRQPSPVKHETNQQKSVLRNQESSTQESQSEDSALLPASQGLLVTEAEENMDPDGIAEQIELMESGGSEMDLSTLPTAVVIEIFQGVGDKGLSHAVDAVCAMKPTDQARFGSVIVEYLLLPRLQQSDIRGTRQVISAFNKFISCCPGLSCQQLVAPLIVTTPTQHMDTLQNVLRQIKSQQQKDLILKYVMESLPAMLEPHLPLFFLLIGPSENNQVKQQLVKILVESVDRFPNSIHFGKLLLAVIPLVSALPELKTQLTDVVNLHQSAVKSTALRLLCK